MTLEVNESILYINPNTEKEEYVNAGDDIFNINVAGVLLALGTQADLYKNPTDEQLQKELKKLLDFYVDTFKQDFEHYAKYIIPKLIKRTTGNKLKWVA